MEFIERFTSLLKAGSIFCWQRTNRVRTPTVLQMEMTECGAAALGIVLGYYGRIVPLPELRQECGVSRDGSRASNLLKAAQRYGAQAEGFKTEPEYLKELPLPLIVFWHFNHFLVVEGFGRNRVFVNDPATGPRTVTRQEFDEGFTGVVLVIQPGSQFQKKGRKPNTFLALWRRLRGATGVLVYCLTAGLLLTLTELFVPVFSQVFIDKILIQGQQDWLRPLIVGIAVTTVLQGLIYQVQLRHLRRLQIKLAVGTSSQFLWHLLRLPINFYDQRFAGEIVTRLQLNDQVAQALSGELAINVISAIVVVIYALVMLQYDPVLTGIGISFATANLLALSWVARRRVDSNMRLMQERGKMVGTAISGLQSMETIKAGGLESDFFSRWSGYYAKALNAQQELALGNLTLGVLPSFLAALSMLLILVIGGLRVMNGSLSIGMLVAFQSLMVSFLRPIENLVNFGSRLQELEGDVNRLEDVLQNPTVAKHSKILQQEVKLQGYVELCNISFGYSPIEPPLLENFSLSIQPGQRVALVGATGSGKSTLAKLVAGLYEPWDGEIYFDGMPRSQIPRTVLTNSLAMVEQDFMLFSGSVQDNLTLWDNTIPKASLVRACQDAAIHEVVLSLSGGYTAQLQEGATNLSGGQRQRLEIARALVKNPSILVLDEATSALDPETEQIIDQNLRQRGITCLVVAHRLSTVRDCDEIIVLERGKVLERGTHEELWSRNGYYAQLLENDG